jgi:hypothetical protein
MERTLESLNLIDVSKLGTIKTKRAIIKDQEQLDYALSLAKIIKDLKDVSVRVEDPWLTIYTNSKNDIKLLSEIDTSKVKYISMPPEGVSIQEGTIVLPNRDFDYKITIGRTRQENMAFVEWADANSTKVKLTKACRRELARNRSFGGVHFYLSGEKMLLVAKMHLSGSISKIERIIKK